ncbi:MAG: alginate lyase family protein [Candidatus Pacebacteria bacterium]|nr:alginate lyase family protein [Candidatus Paceibacterota bacterium]
MLNHGRTRLTAIVLGVGLFTRAATGAPSHLVLDDCEGEIRWSCNHAEVTRSDDASQGKYAIGVEVDRPLDVELHFDGFEHGEVDLSEFDLIAFDYKLSGPGEYLDFVIRQYPLNAGRRGNFYPIDQADPRDVWATKILPLEGPENLSLHLEEFDPQAREMYFRITVDPGLEPLRLLVDNVRVMKNPMGIRPITFGRYFRRTDGSVLYQYRIPVRNRSDEPISVLLRPDTSGIESFNVRMGLERLMVAPGETEYASVSIIIPAGVVKNTAAYVAEELVVNVALEDTPGVQLPTRLIASVPPEEFRHPSLLGTETQLKDVLKRVESFPALERTWKQVVRKADEAIKNQPAIPDYNGGGVTTCYVDGTKLTPMQRDGVPFREYVCSKCGRVYHGKRFDSGFSGAGGWYGTHQQLVQDVLYTALVYRVTGEPRYGLRAAEIMNGYTEKYLTYDMLFPNDKYIPLAEASPSSRRICGWHFMENRWLQYMAIAFDLLADTDVMSEEEREAFRERALRPAAQKTTENEVGLNNIQLPNSLAQICAGFALDDPVLVYYGTRESRGVIANIRQNLLDDGTWAESPNYINLVAHELPPFLYLMKRAGIEAYTPRIMRLYSEPPKMANPAGRQPNFGDGSGVPLKGWAAHALLPWLDTGDPELGKVVARYGRQPVRGLTELMVLMAMDRPLPEQEKSTALGCVDFPDSGYLFLRNEAEDLWFAMTYGRHVGHGHYDRLGFELYGAGGPAGRRRRRRAVRQIP